MYTLKQSPHRLTQVKRLIFQNSYFSAQEICALFPNTRKIEIMPYGPHKIVDLNQHLDRFVNTTPPIRSKVQSLSDVFDCSFTIKLIQSYLCHRLETLELKAIGYDTNVIPQLKNLPVLKKLVLNTVDIKASDLEYIHAHFPTIKSLSLHHISLKKSDIILYIESTTSVTKFYINITNVPDIKTHYQLYQYMNRKYAHVFDIGLYNQPLSGLTNKGEVSIGGVPEGTDVFELFDFATAVVKKLNPGISSEYMSLLEHLSCFYQANATEKFSMQASPNFLKSL